MQDVCAGFGDVALLLGGQPITQLHRAGERLDDVLERHGRAPHGRHVAGQGIGRDANELRHLPLLNVV